MTIIECLKRGIGKSRLAKIDVNSFYIDNEIVEADAKYPWKNVGHDEVSWVFGLHYLTVNYGDMTRRQMVDDLKFWIDSLTEIEM